MTTLEDKHNFELGYEKGCKDTKERIKQKLQQVINEFPQVQGFSYFDYKLRKETEDKLIELKKRFEALLGSKEEEEKTK